MKYHVMFENHVKGSKRENTKKYKIFGQVLQ